MEGGRKVTIDHVSFDGHCRPNPCYYPADNVEMTAELPEYESLRNLTAIEVLNCQYAYMGERSLISRLDISNQKQAELQNLPCPYDMKCLDNTDPGCMPAVPKPNLQCNQSAWNAALARVKAPLTFSGRIPNTATSAKVVGKSCEASDKFVVVGGTISQL
eukprot:877400_1